MASWLDLLIAAGGWYGQKKRDDKAGDTKNIPLTPQEEWLFNTGKDTWKYSPARDFGSETAYQAMQGMSNNQFNPTYKSDYMKGEKLPQFPKLDFSQMPKYWRGNYEVGKPFVPEGGAHGIGGGYGTTGGGASPTGGRALNQVGGIPRGDDRGPFNRVEPPDTDSYGRAIGSPQYGETIADWLGRNPGGNPAEYLPNQGQGGSYNPDGGVWTTSTGEKLFLPPEKYKELTTPPDDIPEAERNGWRGLIDKGLNAIAQNGVKWLIQVGVGGLATFLSGGNAALGGLAGKGAGWLYNHFNPTQAPTDTGGAIPGSIAGRTPGGAR